METKSLRFQKLVFICLVLLFPLTLLALPKSLGSQIDSLISHKNDFQIDTSYNFMWNHDLAQWEKHQRTINYYGKYDRLELSLSQNWDSTQGWQNIKRLYQGYNSKNQLCQKVYQSWDRSTTQWRNQKFSKLMYEEGNNSDIYIYLWNQAQERWQKNIHAQVTYTFRGRKRSILTKVFSPSQKSWTNHEKINYHYIAKYTKPHKSIILYWDKAKQSWQRNGRYVMDYTAAGNMNSKTLSSWSTVNQAWQYNIKYSYKWSGSHKTAEIKYIWNQFDSNWFQGFKTIYKYDNWGELELEEKYKWSTAQQKWELSDKILHTHKLDQLNATHNPEYNSRQYLFYQLNS